MPENWTANREALETRLSCFAKKKYVNSTDYILLFGEYLQS